MPNRGSYRLAFVRFRNRALGLSRHAGASACTRVLLVAAAAAGTAACSVSLGYLDDGAGARSDGSIVDDATTDATTAPDHTSIDGPSGDEDVASENDGNVPVGDSAPNNGPPALPPDAGTVTCPITINDVISPSDEVQTGRDSRFGPATTCLVAQPFPGTTSDPNQPHLFQIYRFANTTAASSCMTFTLYYDEAGAPSPANDAGDADASTQRDAGGSDASTQADAGEAGASTQNDGDAGPAGPLYMSAYSTFYPANLSAGGYLGNTGGDLYPPQSMSITVPAGGTIDVEVVAVDVAPNGGGTFTLTCTP